jgi:hypothetical protein
LLFYKNFPLLNLRITFYSYFYRLIKTQNSPILSYFTKLTFFTHARLMPTLFVPFTQFFYKNHGLILTNFAKTLIGNLLCTQIKTLTKFFWIPPLRSNLYSRVQVINTLYLKTTQVITIKSHRSIYKTLIFYILNLLTMYYTTQLPNYQIFYNFIFFQKPLNLTLFLNFFYFKVRNY